MEPEAGGARWARRSKRFRLGLLATLATALPAVDVQGPAAPWFHAAGLAVASLALGLAALLEGRGENGRPMVLLATVVTLAGLHDVLLTRPALTLLLGLGAVLLTARNQRPLPTGGLDLAEPYSLPAWGALLPTLWVALAVGGAPHPQPLPVLAATATGILGAGLALVGFYGIRTPRSWPRRLGLGVWLAAVATAALALENHGLRLFGLTLASVTPVLADVWEAPRGRPFASWADPIASRPALMLAVTFGVTAAVGAVLLWLPVSAAGEPVSGVDAFFTAVSATCVTGLIVLDTPNAFSGFGQLVVFTLFQVGGLGIMTFSTAALAVLRRRPSMKHERALTDLFVAKEGQDHVGAVKDVLRVTIITELVGALLLTILFAARHGDDLGTALWRGLFTSVSAFCNAGFSLQTDSLMPYARDPLVLYTISAIIIVGGLGPVATLAVRDIVRRRPISIAVRLIFITSILLTVGGTVIIGAFEWQASLQNLDFFDRIHNAVFQSVTLRTAGFNSVDFAQLRPETQILMLPFMLVGGSPGSTAGGIKTTTFAVVLLSMVAVIRGRPEALVKKRRIGHATFYRAVAITTLGLGSAFLLWMLVVLTQDIDPLSAVFEAFSAVGTVGVSVGATGRLDDVGKLLVAAGMFAGRLGPLTLLLLFAARRRPPPFTHPEVGVPVG